MVSLSRIEHRWYLPKSDSESRKVRREWRKSYSSFFLDKRDKERRAIEDIEVYVGLLWSQRFFFYPLLWATSMSRVWDNYKIMFRREAALTSLRVYKIYAIIAIEKKKQTNRPQSICNVAQMLTTVLYYLKKKNKLIDSSSTGAFMHGMTQQIIPFNQVTRTWSGSAPLTSSISLELSRQHWRYQNLGSLLRARLARSSHHYNDKVFFLL